MNSETIIKFTEDFGAHNYSPLPVVLSRGEGVWVWDMEGRRYMDMLSSYSALNQGHRHPVIMKALFEQAERLTLTSRAFYNDQLGPFLKELVELCGMEMALPMNTGAEAVETAIKCARKWGYERKGVEDGKAEIIVCQNNFHGRTTTIIGFSTDEEYRKNFGPFTPNFKIIPYNDPVSLEEAINDTTVAFLVEPIQGEAGVIVPDEGYLSKVRDICAKKGILLLVDEIQTGFGRCGSLFASDMEGVKPDILIIGKALGGGVLPISAVVSSREILSVFQPGQHGSTFGGNPLACAVARAAMRVIIEEKLADNARRMGERFLKGLKGIASDAIKEVRGRGLLIAVEIYPSSGDARDYVMRLKEEGLLCKETHRDVIRFAPPLVIKEEEIDWALERIEKVFKGR